MKRHGHALLAKESDDNVSKMDSSALVIREATEVLRPKNITVRWVIQEDERDTLEAKHKITLQTKVVVPDLQAISGAEWRDKLRIMLSFDKLKLQFESLVLYFRKDGEDEDVDLLNTDWNTIQAIIQGLEIDDKTTRIKLRTMSFKTKQNSTRMARCSYGASTVHAFTDGWDAISSRCAAGKGRHYCSKSSYKYIYKTSLAKQNGATQEQQEARAQRFIAKCLGQVAARVGSSKDPTAGPGCPNPSKVYKNEEAVKRMLKQHDDVDIRDAKERRKWILKMLDRHGAPKVSKFSENVNQTVRDLGASAGVSQATDQSRDKHPPTALILPQDVMRTCVLS